MPMTPKELTQFLTPIHWTQHYKSTWTRIDWRKTGIEIDKQNKGGWRGQREGTSFSFYKQSHLTSTSLLIINQLHFWTHSTYSLNLDFAFPSGTKFTFPERVKVGWLQGITFFLFIFSTLLSREERIEQRQGHAHIHWGMKGMRKSFKAKSLLRLINHRIQRRGLTLHLLSLPIALNLFPGNKERSSHC